MIKTFFSFNRCFSSLGMIGGKQTVNIGRGCERKVQYNMKFFMPWVESMSRVDQTGITMSSLIETILNEV